MAESARVAATVRGLVQGVGFRPAVHRLAQRWQLSGWVRNRAGVVEIEAQGPRAAVEAMLAELSRSPPVGAQIAQLETSWLPPLEEQGFVIQSSEQDASSFGSSRWLPLDRATCDNCLAEHDTPADRRAGYPFIACSDCGPRFSHVHALPYDRSRTSLAGFAPCVECAAEYVDTASRRFHAENVACAACGPRLTFSDRGTRTERAVLERTLEALNAGRIGAIKGLGGYHLACDAENPSAVAELRARKGRQQKPFALLLPTPEAAARLCRISAPEHRVLTGPERPIVLLRREGDSALSAGVAMGSHLLGIMLPYTALHAALAQRFGRPLVLTSGNRSEEPMAASEREATEQLGTIADFFVHHDRPIAVRVDDSVVRVIDDELLVMRAGRGFAPVSLELARPLPRPVVALGGDLKSAFALGQGTEVVLSHHIGDLGDVDTESALEHAIGHYREILACTPEMIAHDLHPDFASTRVAGALARRLGARRSAVQHHHAHFAGCLLEARHDGPAIGVIFDGLGLGSDGALWGGEVLVGDARSVRRFAHLRYVRAPGGDRAAEQPWRMALAYLIDAGESTASVRRFASETERALVQRLIERGLASPWTSSIGRLFDAVAAMLGLAGRNDFEAQAAVLVEGCADGVDEKAGYGIALVRCDDHFELDARPMVRALCQDRARGVPVEIMAARFHRGLSQAVVDVAKQARADSDVRSVALSGGVFMNAVLLSQCQLALQREGFAVHRPRRTPPNDGGLALGQLAIASTP